MALSGECTVVDWEFINDDDLWMVKVNGLIVDIRCMLIEIQQQAYEMGIIPYVPAGRDNST